MVIIDGDFGSDAFLYKDGTMYDLNNLLSSSSGWTIAQATAIDDAGNILAIGISDDQSWAIELTPDQGPGSSSGDPVATPEPGAVVLTAAGLIGLGGLRWNAKAKKVIKMLFALGGPNPIDLQHS